jgi:ABC-type glycerol-3-phosphate transport system substrate-binding protein
MEYRSGAGAAAHRGGLSRRGFFARSAAGLIATSAAAAGVAGCGPVNRTGGSPVAGSNATQGTTAPAKALVTLTAWYSAWSTPEVNARSLEFLKQFQQLHPHITVDWQGVEWAGAGAMLAKLPVAAASGYMPDTFRSHWSIHGSVVHQGWVRPLDEQMKAAKLARADFTPSTWDIASYRGRIYGVPNDAYAYAPWWNKDVFAKSGLDPEKPPTTFDELLDVSVRVHRAGAADAAGGPSGPGGASGGGQGEIGQLGWNYKMTAPGHFAFLFGGNVYDKEKEHVTPDDPGVVEALSWLLALTKRQGGHAAVEKFWEGRGSTLTGTYPFYTGHMAFMTAGTGNYQYLQKFAPDARFGVMLYPGKRAQAVGGAGGAQEAQRNVENTTVQTEILPISQASKHPDETWAFLKWLLVDQAAEWAWRSVSTPCLIRAIDPFYEKLAANVVGKDSPLTKYFDVFKEVSRRGSRHWPTIPRSSEYLQGFTAAWNCVLQEKASPEAAMKELARTEQAELDRLLAAK